MDRIGERLNDFCIMVLKLFYIQLLWLLFTLLGFVLFGVGPATYAMFTVMRQWIRGNKDLPIFKNFLQAFRSGFKESVLIGILYLASGIILYVDLLYVQSQVLRGLLIVIGFIYLISLCYIFPIMVHYDWKRVSLKLKCSILFGISYLQYTLVLFASIAVVYLILLRYSGTIAFFGISVGGYMIMWMANQVFKRIEIQAGVMEAKAHGQVIKGGGEA
jgi:uncharacterized membrane protein YesL